MKKWVLKDSFKDIRGYALRLSLFFWMCLVAYLTFFFVYPSPKLGDVYRSIIFHIPMAWIAVLAFLLGTFYSFAYLKRRKPSDDGRAVVFEELGLHFCILATITGSIFAKVTWGSFWNWDPRETSIFILLLIYGAYFALRSAVGEEEKKASLSAVYAILSFITVPFLVFVVPRVMFSLHPDIMGGGGADPGFRIALAASLLGFTALFFWMYKMRFYVEKKMRGIA